MVQDGSPPLTISYRKLSDWLVQRSKLPADWRKRLAAIRAKAKEVSTASGGPGSDEDFDYWAACSHATSLEDSATRSLLGTLTGPAGDWARIIKTYEKQNVHLGESAALLVTLAAYEIPALKAQAGKQQQQLGDLERRMAEHRRSAASAAQQHAQECKHLGIQGRHPAAEIQRLPAQLPQLLLNLHATHITSQQVVEAATLYQSFCSPAPCQQDGGADDAGPPSSPGLVSNGSPAEVLAALAWAQHCTPGSQADVSVPGTGSEASTLPADPEEPPGSQAQAEGKGDDASAMDIQWDVDVSAAAEEATQGGRQGGDEAPADIQWDIEVPEAGAQAAEGPSIDWDIEEAEPSVKSNGSAAPPTSLVPEDGTPPSQPCPDTFVARFAGDQAWRLKLQDDLHELQAFLQQRRAEMVSPSYEALTSGLPSAYRDTTVEQVKTMLSAVKAAVEAVGGAPLAQLINILSSPEYRRFLLHRLELATSQEAKFHRLAGEAKHRQQAVQRALVEDSTRLDEASTRLQDVRGRLERRIAELFGGRLVQITGI